MRVLGIFCFFLMVISSAQSAIPGCYQKIEQTFFNPQFVSQALAMHDFPQSSWTEFNRHLRERAVVVPTRVKKLAERLMFNPFAIPFDPEEAGAVLEEVLTEVLFETLLEFNVKNPAIAKKMFLYIRERQLNQWNACFSLPKSNS